jgi:alkylation response protein AidB-like acyl-CoA dehydrogenase
MALAEFQNAAQAPASLPARANDTPLSPFGMDGHLPRRATQEEVSALAATHPSNNDCAALLQAVRTLADGPLSDAAANIDRGTYPRDLMVALGAAGVYGAHLGPGQQAGNFASAIRAMAEVSRVCGATGFMVWCQQVCGVYLQQSANPALTGSLLQRHATGQRLGATGMSNPMKAYAGIEPLLLKARPVPGGYLVNGNLPWVSNLGPDHYAGVLAGVQGLAEGESREVMFLLRCDAPGVELRACPSFSAMEGTNTWALRCTDLFIGADDIVADPAKPFIARIRGAFILLQTGFGLGVTQGAIDSMWRVEPALGHVNQFLDERPDELQAELDALWQRIEALALTPYANGKDYFIDVLDARAHTSELALRAAQSALLHAGARGYLLSSDVQRRVRESHFVAIVSPAIKHLRKEIARLSALELPA